MRAIFIILLYILLLLLYYCARLLPINAYNIIHVHAGYEAVRGSTEAPQLFSATRICAQTRGPETED